jgi:hypothetical protein
MVVVRAHATKNKVCDGSLDIAESGLRSDVAVSIIELTSNVQL